MTNEEFIKLWNSAKNVGEVVEKTGLKYDSVVKKAFRLREKGYDVKRYEPAYRNPSLASKAGKMKK